jgi:hypothetical protein
MQSKILLTEQSIIFGEIPSILKLDLDRIKTNIVKNYAFGNFKSNDDFNYLKDYLKIDDDQHITWLLDYIRDHYRAEYERTPAEIEYGPIAVVMASPVTATPTFGMTTLP